MHIFKSFRFKSFERENRNDQAIGLIQFLRNQQNICMYFIKNQLSTANTLLQEKVKK